MKINSNINATKRFSRFNFPIPGMSWTVGINKMETILKVSCLYFLFGILVLECKVGVRERLVRYKSRITRVKASSK